MVEGWAAIPNWMVRSKDVTPNMLAVYAVIQSHAGSAGTTRLLVQTIADEAGVSYSTAYRATKALNAMGVLWWEAQGEATQRTASIYHPLQEANPAVVEAVHAPASKRTKRSARPSRTVTAEELVTVSAPEDPLNSATPDAVVRSPEPSRTVTDTSSYGQGAEVDSVRSQGPYVRSQGPREEEPSKKNSSPPTSSPTGDGFREFWAQYPDTGYKGRKEDCRKIWTSLDLEARRDAYRALMAYKNSELWEDTARIPSPLTWLDNDPWLLVKTGNLPKAKPDTRIKWTDPATYRLED